MTFAITKLAGGRALISGKDKTGGEGKTIVDTTEWDSINAITKLDNAHEDFDAKVQEFFAPLVEAAEALDAAHATVNTDSAFYIVRNEGVDTVEGHPEEIIQLSQDSVFLRLIEEDASAPRLIWINENHLEILEVV